MGGGQRETASVVFPSWPIFTNARGTTRPLRTRQGVLRETKIALHPSPSVPCILSTSYSNFHQILVSNPTTDRSSTFCGTCRLDSHAHLTIVSWAVWCLPSGYTGPPTSDYISPTCFRAYVICLVPLDFWVCGVWFKYKRLTFKSWFPWQPAAWIWARPLCSDRSCASYLWGQKEREDGKSLRVCVLSEVSKLQGIESWSQFPK